jgi:hypothetical protein
MHDLHLADWMRKAEEIELRLTETNQRIVGDTFDRIDDTLCQLIRQNMENLKADPAFDYSSDSEI